MAKLIVDMSDDLKAIIDEYAKEKGSIKNLVLAALAKEIPGKAKLFMAEASGTIKEIK